MKLQIIWVYQQRKNRYKNTSKKYCYVNYYLPCNMNIILLLFRYIFFYTSTCTIMYIFFVTYTLCLLCINSYLMLVCSFLPLRHNNFFPRMLYLVISIYTNFAILSLRSLEWLSSVSCKLFVLIKGVKKYIFF